MSRSDDSAWYELRPNGHPSIAVWNPKRYRSQPEAEEAAARMRQRSPDFRFVEILRCEVRDGKLAPPTPVARV
jgi:hypothetical protein